ncbi:Rib/alpha-like domain-containing protein [Corynebacterium hadale]|uniref:Rib/alpha-like domain-containing protein n=1 Tax=Corynebacterium hadale TaxID=2026255 RepID=UPI000BAA89BD|nr:Rib/alpha-like domain-containing protein [Corynebacterium hadale]PAT08533.1 hypothetical protein CKJ82_04035 [Corynebacterium hadale]
MRSIFTPRKVDLRPALAASMAATLAISGTAAVSIAAPPAAYAQATDEAPARLDTDVPQVDGAPVGLKGTNEEQLPWFMSYQPTYADYYTGAEGEEFKIPAPEFWEFYPGTYRQSGPPNLKFKEAPAPSEGNSPGTNPDGWNLKVHEDGSITGKVPAKVAPLEGVSHNLFLYTFRVLATGPEGDEFTTDVTFYVDKNKKRGEESKLEDLPPTVLHQPKFPRHPLILAPGESYTFEGISWDDPVRDPESNKDWPDFEEYKNGAWEPGNSAPAKFEWSKVGASLNADKFCGSQSEGKTPTGCDYNENKIEFGVSPEEGPDGKHYRRITITAGPKDIGRVELPITFDYRDSYTDSNKEPHNAEWDTVNLPMYIGTVKEAAKYQAVSDLPMYAGISGVASADLPQFRDTTKPGRDGQLLDAPKESNFFVSTGSDDKGIEYRKWVSIEEGADGSRNIVTRPENLTAEERDSLLQQGVVNVPIQVKFADKSISRAFFVPIHLYKTHELTPTDDSQNTGVTVDPSTQKASISATWKDEDGVDQPFEESDIEIRDGQVWLNPGTGTPGPIVVSVNEGDDRTLANNKFEAEVPVAPATVITCEEGDSTYCKPVDPTDEPQKTGIKVTGPISPKDDIEATWADEEGNTGTIDPDNITIDGGEVFITPGTDAKGEITVEIDNSTMKEPFKTKLHVNTQADRYTPEVSDKHTVTVGKTLDRPLAKEIVTNIDDLPSGTKADFKPEDGKAPVANDEGNKDVTIVVTYPDGSTEEVTTKVTVTEATVITCEEGDSTYCKPVDPTDEPQKTGIKVTGPISPKDDIEATWADEEGNTGTIDPDNITIDGGEVFITPGTDAKGEITVEIDNSTMKEPFKTKLHVNTQADRYTPEVSDKHTVTVGKTLDRPLAKEIVTNIDDLPSGTKADFKPEDGKAPVANDEGNKDVTIVVTYPDGTSEEIQTDLTVKRRTDAETNDPTVDEDFEIVAGSKLRQEHAEKIIENIGSLPSGTTADFKDKGEGSLSTENPTPNDIDKDVTIVVTYPDGSTEEIDTKITIKPRPDNWDFQPQVREKVITAGDKLEAHDVIENLHELPQDIEVELDGDVDTSTPGAYNPQVVVTYPDGSQDRVGSTVIVNPKPLTNKQFDPNYGDTVKLTAGESKSAENPFGDETAPEGTKYEAKFRSDATDWTFDEDKANETGVVTAQAPSARDLAQEFARVTKYTHLDWDTLAAVLKPMVTTSVEVDIDYADGSFDAATATFELVDADGHSLLDPEADADGDGHTNRDEVEKRSNPFDEESVPVPPADWNTSNANTVYPGEDVTVPNNGGRVQVGTTVKVDGPGTAEINKDGDLVITANEDAKPGDKIVATMTDSDGNQIDIVQVSVKEDERLQGDKTNATFGSDPYVLIPGETKDTNRPFGPFGIPDDTEITVQVPADATDWKFEGNEDGTVTAQAPSAAQLAAQFSALDKAVQKDWDKLAEALAPVVAPTVGVNFTFTDGSNDFANARFELTDANDKSILDPDADFDDDGRTNKQEVATGTNPFERNYFEPHWDATEGEGSAEPGGKLTIPNKGGKIPKGAIVDVAGPGSAVIDDRGNLVVAVEEQAIPGDEITATVKDEQGAEIQRIVIIVNAKVNSNTHTAVGEPGKDTSLSSNIDQGKCSAAAIGFGLPMLAIVPLAIATQAAIPGLAGFREQVAVQIEQVNSQIQNGLGIMNPQIAKQVSDINGQLRQYGTNVATIGGGLLLFAAGIGVTALIVDSCKPGGPTSSN